MATALGLGRTAAWRGRRWWLGPAACIAALGVGIATALFAGAVALVTLGSAAALLVAVRPGLALYALVAVMVGMHFFYNASVTLGGVNVFPIDAAVLLTVYAAYAAAAQRGLIGRRLNAAAWGLGIFLAFLALAAVRGLAEGHDPKSVALDAKIGLYLGVMFAVRQLLVTPACIRRLLRFGAGLLALALVYDVYSRVTGQGYYPFDPAAIEVTLSSGTYSRAFGMLTAIPYYGVGIAFGLAMVTTGSPLTTRGRAFILGGVSLALTLLVLQLIRGLFVGLLGLLLVLFVMSRLRERLRLAGLWTVLGLVLVSAGLLLEGNDRPVLTDVAERVGTLVNAEASTSKAAATSSQRVEFISRTWDDLASSGDLAIGRGLGYLESERLEGYYPSIAFHSAPAWLLRRVGVLGIMVFLGLLAAFALDLIRALRSVRSPDGRALAIGSAAALAFLTGAGVAENYLLQYAFTVPFVGILLSIPSAVGPAPEERGHATIDEPIPGPGA